MNMAAPISNPFLSLALAYAKRGWHVFPCNPLTKRPIVPNGHLAAAVDANVISDWWRRYPNAMIGCATGPRSGFWVLDADRDLIEGKDGISVLAAMGVLPDTVEQATPRGGLHKLFRWDPARPVRNSASRLGPDIDVRGEGGYVVLAGSVRSDGARYEWSISPENGAISEAPDWLYEAIRRAKPKTDSPVDPSLDFPFEGEKTSDAAASAFKQQCLRVAGAGEGSRNDTLNTAAFEIGLFVGRGEMGKSRAAEGLLRAAGECGLAEDDGEDSCKKTIASGLSAGIRAGRESLPDFWFEEIAEEKPAVKEPEYVSIFGEEAPYVPDPLLHILPVSDLAGLPIPKQAWLVPDLIPARNVTLLYGDGGTGKSLLALQLCFSVATGASWVGLKTATGPAMFITAEDEIEELQRRLEAICSPEGYLFSDLTNLHVSSLNGKDAVLAAPNMKTGLMEPTRLFASVRAQVMKLRPMVLVLDTLADLFGGDEIKRIQARQFIGMLQGLVAGADWGLSIVLLAHPSLSGMNSGSGTSGNTAWSNSVRSRLYLSRRLVKRDKAPDLEPDPDARVLSNKKTNRSKVGGETTLRWSAGRFIAVANVAADTEQDVADEAIFMALLDEYTKAGRNVSEVPSSPSFAGRRFMENKVGSEVGRGRLVAAMNRLFGRGSLKIGVYGPRSKQHTRIERA